MSWFMSVMNDEMTFRVVHLFTCLGLQDWQAGASVQVDRGIVTHIGYGVLVRGRGDWVLGRTTDEFQSVPVYLQDRMGQRSYFVNEFNITTFGGGEGIESSLTPLASTEEKDRAYDLDFDCLTKLGGCTSLCQIAPSSFADLAKETHYLPYRSGHDPNCARFIPPDGIPGTAPNP
jgi:hypothetical protein